MDLSCGQFLACPKPLRSAFDWPPRSLKQQLGLKGSGAYRRASAGLRHFGGSTGLTEIWNRTRRYAEPRQLVARPDVSQLYSMFSDVFRRSRRARVGQNLPNLAPMMFCSRVISL